VSEWKSVRKCKLCEKAPCIVNAENPQMGYCYTEKRSFFLNDDGIIYKKSKKQRLKNVKIVYPSSPDITKKKPDCIFKQCEFDF